MTSRRCDETCDDLGCDRLVSRAPPVSGLVARLKIQTIQEARVMPGVRSGLAVSRDYRPIPASNESLYF